MKYSLTLESDNAESLLSILCSASRLGIKAELNKVGGPVEASVPKAAKRSSRVKPDWDALMILLTAKQKVILRIIKSRVNGVTVRDLATILHQTEIRSISGTIGGGLMHNIPKAGYEISDIIVIKGKTQPAYAPGPVLLNNEIPPVHEERD